LIKVEIVGVIMQNKKTLITGMVLNNYIDTYSEKEFNEHWEKLQHFLKDCKNDKRLYSESAFDAEWIDEVFCNILDYPKKLKSREYWTINGAGKKEERIDGVFYDDDGKTVKIVIELKSLETTDLFKKIGNLSPITQGAKYLFQTKNSELAVVSNFDKIVIFDRKEDFRQSWSLFEMTFEQFKEFYLVLSFKSVYRGLTKSLINNSTSPKKDIDEEFYNQAASIFNFLHKTIENKYADDLFNKFLALIYLEDCSKLPPSTTKAIYDKKTDFVHNLKTHFSVFASFFNAMKNNKSSRNALGISDEVASMPVWKNISYFEKIKIPKLLIDKVLLLSEYNLKSIPINKLFFSLAKKIYSPYCGVDYFEDDETEFQYNFYKEFFTKNLDFEPVDICLAFPANKFRDHSNHLISLYNQLSHNKIDIFESNKKFSIHFTVVNDEWPTQFDSFYTAINKSDLENSEIFKEIKNRFVEIKLFEYHNGSYAIIFLKNDVTDSFILEDDNGVVSSLKKSDFPRKLKLLNRDEAEWLNNYNSDSVNITDYVDVVTDKNLATHYFNLIDGSITEKDEFGYLEKSDYYSLDFYEDAVEVLISIKKEDLRFALSNSEFKKYISLNDFKDISMIKISNRLLNIDAIELEKHKSLLTSNISDYEYKLRKLKRSESNCDLEMIKIERILDSLYEQMREFDE